MSKHTYGECSVSYCTNLAINKRRVLCANHLARWRKGLPGWNKKSQYEKTEEERFWEKVDKNGPVPPYAPDLGPCWIWQGGISTAQNGEQYGRFRCPELSPHSLGAYRVAFYYATGLVSDRENDIDHLCRVTRCVNPSHLELVSDRENVRRGFGPTAENSRKTHCIWGHELTDDNVYVEANGRKCRTCRRNRSREWARRQREKSKKL